MSSGSQQSRRRRARALGHAARPAALALEPALASSRLAGASAAGCSLPAQQQLKNAQKKMHGEQVVTFPIERYAKLGTVTENLAKPAPPVG